MSAGSLVTDKFIRRTPFLPKVRLLADARFVGQLLILARHPRAMTTRNVAERLGYSHTTVANREYGKAVGAVLEYVKHLDAMDYAVVIMTKGEADALCGAQERLLPQLADLPSVLVPTRPGRG